MSPFVVVKFNPGGKPAAVKFVGVFAPVTLKLNGWPRNATAESGLVMFGGAAGVFVGYNRVAGMTIFA
jgi:hypothetical protein